MPPRKPTRVASAAEVPDEQCSPGVADLASNLKALLQLDFDGDGASELLQQLFGSIAALMSSTSNHGIWEAARKHRFPLALSKICDWALVQLSTAGRYSGLSIHLAHRAALIWAQVVKVSSMQHAAAQQDSKGKLSTAGWLVKELLRLEVPSKLLRAALAVHDIADLLPPSPSHAPGSCMLPLGSVEGGTGSSIKAAALKAACFAAMPTQSCILSTRHGREVCMQVTELARCGRGVLGGSCFSQPLSSPFVFLF